MCNQIIRSNYVYVWRIEQKRIFKRISCYCCPGNDAGMFGSGYEKEETFWDFHAVEYVNQFFKDKAKDKKYLAELKSRSTGIGVTNVLIMCDGEGHMGDNDEKKRMQTVENHKKWVEAAKFLTTNLKRRQK